mgnify:CR=1 FL=1
MFSMNPGAVTARSSVIGSKLIYAKKRTLIVEENISTDSSLGNILGVNRFSG